MDGIPNTISYRFSSQSRVEAIISGGHINSRKLLV